MSSKGPILEYRDGVEERRQIEHRRGCDWQTFQVRAELWFGRAAIVAFFVVAYLIRPHR